MEHQTTRKSQITLFVRRGGGGVSEAVPPDPCVVANGLMYFEERRR